MGAFDLRPAPAALTMSKLRMRLLVAIVALALVVSLAAGCRRTSARAPQTQQIAGLEIAIWLPQNATAAPLPVIVFSHGFHGCNTQSVFLMAALADSGYAVFAPNHRDAGCGDRRAWQTHPVVPFREPQNWTDATYADRALDLKRLIDALAADPRYRSLDWQRLGVAGHSLGGYTVLELGGASATLKDKRVKAVLALSPYAQPFVVHHTLSRIDVPVMYQGGTRDFAMTPFISRSGGAYDATPPPKYFVEFDRAGHLAWTDLRESDHTTIIRYARAFFDRYLKDVPFPQALASPHGDVVVVRMQP